MEQTTPLVTVIVPTYNRAVMIVETLSAILQQSFKNFELLVISNGSTDNTESVVAGLNDQRIIFFQLPPSGRPAVPRNRGIKEAKGKYIAFCDDDDLWLPDKLQKQVDFMESNPDTALCFGYAERFGDTDRSGSLLHPTAESDGVKDFMSLFLGNKIPTFTVMVRKDCLDEVGCFDEDPKLTAIEDYDLWLRVAHKQKIACIPAVLGKYRVHQNNFSSNMVLERMKLLKLVEKFDAKGFIDAQQKKSIESNLFWLIGNAKLRTKEAGFREWFFKAFKNRMNVKSLFALGLCLLPVSVALNLFSFLEERKNRHSHQ